MIRSTWLVVSVMAMLVSASVAFVPTSRFASTNARQAVVLHANPLDRFLNPKIDDPGLPLSEAGLAQIVGPSLQIFWLVSMNSAYPSWARPIGEAIFPGRGAFLAPTLIHGAGLSCCWLAGCLAAKGFEKDAYKGDFGKVLFSTIKAGAFACGLLILATQIDLYVEMGGYVQIGDSAETDIRIYTALVEVINDIFFEAVTLISWRLFRSTLPE